GGLTLDQQLNSAAEEFVQTEDAITGFLGSITAYLSAIGFLVQVGLVSYVHRALGVGFALLVLPVSWGATAILILLTPVLWTISVARILDASLRYTLDKTTREVLFLPLPPDLKFKAKPFVDVTADRFLGKGLGAAVLLVLIKLFGFTWWQLSYLSLTVCIIWMYLTRKARQEYMAVFRRSIERLELEPGTLAPQVGEPATIETLVEELASPDENRVIRSIELLESLDKRHLVTPLLLRHESPRVRSRALLAMKQASPGTLARLALAVERSLEDEDADVRAEAVSVLAVIRGKDVTAIMRPYLEDKDSRIATAAAASLAESDRQDDRLAAEETLARLAADTREVGKKGRRDVARVLARCSYARFRRLLIPLMHDADTSVALESIRSSRHLGDQDLLFVPALVSRLADRRLKNAARGALASYGERVVDTLGYFLVDENENIWVRRHIPGTLARIPSRPSVEVLVGALDDDDGLIRFKAVSALERIRKARPELGIETAAVEKITVRDIGTYYRCLGTGFNLFDRGGLPRGNLLGQALDEKRRRAMDRVYRLLALALDRKDVRAARWAIERGDARSRASAVEYLDNVLSGRIRKMLLPILDQAPLEETVRKGNVFLKTRVKGIEETLARLIYDDDPVIAATAIDLVREREVWSLAEDLEQVLQFREPKDYIVFESASRALADYRTRPRA
ncbi:MAG TPA: Npt1/Npt2 family nucleotide transporter, partial [Vicinamibacteria bacterium]|nr:Npt1/Npt2 family nucleotide transporter [Vicinamibacteria bacterium]